MCWEKWAWEDSNLPGEDTLTGGRLQADAPARLSIEAVAGAFLQVARVAGDLSMA